MIKCYNFNSKDVAILYSLFYSLYSDDFSELNRYYIEPKAIKGTTHFLAFILKEQLAKFSSAQKSHFGVIPSWDKMA